MTTPDINRILARQPVRSRYGAPMGASDRNDADAPRALYLQPVQMIDGDYAPDGTYWGGICGTSDLWCAFDAEGDVRLYVRAATRPEAAAALAGKLGEHSIRDEADDEVLRQMTDGYIECAVFADAPEGSRARPSSQMRKRAAEHVASFFAEHRDLVKQAIAREGYTPTRAGHDLWFGRRGHGVGYWDRKELDAGRLGKQLADAARAEGDCELWAARGWLYLN